MAEVLSVAASITGVLTAGAHIASTIQKLVSSLTNAPAFAQEICQAISEFVVVLSQLQSFILGSSSPIHSRTSMINVEQLTMTLTGCVCTFSELEREVKGLGPWEKMGLLDRVKWSWVEPRISQLAQRLQNHKLSLTLMVSIFTCESSIEAKDSMDKLCTNVQQLIESNSQMSSRLQRLESCAGSIKAASLSVTTIRPGSRDGSDIIGSIRTTKSYRSAFEAALFNTGVYKQELLDRARSAISLKSLRKRHTRHTILYGVSLAEAPNISTLSLPLSVHEVYNPRWYNTNAAASLLASIDEGGMQTSSPNPLALHIAVARGETEAVHILLRQGASVEVKNEGGYTPLMLAAKYGRDEVVGLLLEARTPEKDGMRSLDISLRLAVINGRESTTRLLLTLGANKHNGDASGYTPLHLAAEHGHSSILKLLLDRRGTINAKTNQGDTALILAAMNGQDIAVTRLLSRGAHKDSKNLHGYTALLLAAREDQMSIVHQLLRSKADRWARNIERKTALHLAAAGGHHSTVKLLLAWAASLFSVDIGGNTPLLLAAAFGHTSVVVLLLQRGMRENRVQALLDHRNNEGHTPLHAAAIVGRTPTIAVLLDWGADKEAKTNDESTPLHLAALNGRSNTVQLLLGRGANSEAMTRDGYTVAQVLAARKDMPVPGLPVEETVFGRSSGGNHPGSINFLLATGTTPSPPSRNI